MKPSKFFVVRVLGIVVVIAFCAGMLGLGVLVGRANTTEHPSVERFCQYTASHLHVDAASIRMWGRHGELDDCDYLEKVVWHMESWLNNDLCVPRVVGAWFWARERACEHRRACVAEALDQLGDVMGVTRRY